MIFYRLHPPQSIQEDLLLVTLHIDKRNDLSGVFTKPASVPYGDEGSRKPAHSTGTSWTKEDDALILFNLSRCSDDGKWNKTINSVLWEEASHYILVLWEQKNK